MLPEVQFSTCYSNLLSFGISFIMRKLIIWAFCKTDLVMLYRSIFANVILYIHNKSNNVCVHYLVITWLVVELIGRKPSLPDN